MCDMGAVLRARITVGPLGFVPEEDAKPCLELVCAGPRRARVAEELAQRERGVRATASQRARSVGKRLMYSESSVGGSHACPCLVASSSRPSIHLLDEPSCDRGGIRGPDGPNLLDLLRRDEFAADFLLEA